MRAFQIVLCPARRAILDETPSPSTCHPESRGRALVSRAVRDRLCCFVGYRGWRCSIFLLTSIRLSFNMRFRFSPGAAPSNRREAALLGLLKTKQLAIWGNPKRPATNASAGSRLVARGIPNGWMFPGDVKVAGIAT